VLPAGQCLGEPADVKGSLVRQLLERLDGAYDVIILDTAPVLASADAAILAPIVDGVILVVRAGEAERHAVQHTHTQLTAAGGHVLGVVLNDPAGVIPKYGRYYYLYEEVVEEVA
jgi:Mrp family chromosome partitioning ATPase